jgi:hypothetical protein
METISRAEKYLGGVPTSSSPFPRPLTNFNPIFSSRRSTFRPSCTRQLAQQPLSASVNILLPTYTAAAAAVSCLLSSGQAFLRLVPGFLALTSYYFLRRQNNRIQLNLSINYHATTQIIFNNNAMKMRIRILRYKQMNVFINNY